jgi:threonine dehydratase
MTIERIEQAHKTIQQVLNYTPLSATQTSSQMSGAQLYMKCENLQKTGSFKVRGAYNKIAMLVKEQPVKQVVASSAGNHAQGVAFAASALGIASTIVMPLTAPIAKITATKGYGAQVVLSGSCYDDAYAKACEIQQESGAVFVHAFDDEDVIAGQGSIAIEILHELPTVDTVLVPSGGGGLLAGVASYLKLVNPRIKVIGVQAEGADAIVKSFKEKKNVSTPRVSTIADGIAVKSPGKLTLDYINRYVDDMVTVSDDDIAESILLLLERSKMVVEPAGAVTLAAAIGRKLDIAGKRTVCVLSGGNIDVSMIHKIVQKGMITHGRQRQFSTIISDHPGSLKQFLSVVADCGASIITVQHDRFNAKLSLEEANLHVACEVSGIEHGKELIGTLEQQGYRTIIE